MEGFGFHDVARGRERAGAGEVRWVAEMAAAQIGLSPVRAELGERLLEIDAGPHAFATAVPPLLSSGRGLQKGFGCGSGSPLSRATCLSSDGLESVRRC